MMYSELRSDADILNDIGNAKSVFVLGCPTCTNISLYIQKAAEDSPLYTFTPSGYNAVATGDEVDRLSQLFVSKGLQVDFWVGEYPAIALCVLVENARVLLSKKCQDFETVVALCCDAGIKTIENILKGKKIIPAMNDIGLANAVTKVKMQDETPQYVYLDKDTVSVTHFSFKT